MGVHGVHVEGQPGMIVRNQVGGKGIIHTEGIPGMDSGTRVSRGEHPCGEEGRQSNGRLATNHGVDFEKVNIRRVIPVIFLTVTGTTNMDEPMVSDWN